MRTFSKLKGLPVYSNHDGNILGYVTNLCLSSNGFVHGLMIEGKGLFQRDRFVPIHSIHALGENGVMVDDKNKLLSIQEMRGNYTYSTYDDIHFKTVLTKDGERLGLLEDVYFSEQMGTIEAYELTDGFFADIAEGKKVVKASGEPLTIGKDTIVIDL
ncbi:PRC-barrel domain-containing protein [Metabacillus sediminilitoris]|uniref:Photosystem reaction center subunit H n=1 Tax=Metabacillus sediminilitoris TaxID=2567941 RepID=A0A4S4C3W9_9BACI|nr:PRC-barrel domain-containing protein [Metabacillus sediminilitoris]QGQ47367.1 photosystem reaction center subunit H [Metabacillus sediminilitoris]THF81802.1 photosystem reaction center subunit H [Metabacillus sediminilitoris]